MQNLEVAEPASDISEKDIFEQILNHFGNIKKSWGEPLLKPSQSLSPEDWAKLEALQLELDKEYNLRCEMMMTRLRVTVKSFEWNSTKEALGSLAARYTEKLKMLDDLVSVHKETDIVDLMAARTDLLIIQKTSSELVRRNTQSKLQKHIIGRVPDRGGGYNKWFAHAHASKMNLIALPCSYAQVGRTSIKFPRQKCPNGRRTEVWVAAKAA